MKRKLVISVVALLVALLSQGAFGQTTEDSRDTRLSKEVDALLDSWTQGENPGAAVIVIHQGRIVHKKGYGLADVVARDQRVDAIIVHHQGNIEARRIE